jgi:hypothetical protein
VQEETELGLRPLFSEPPPEMTKPEFERYNRRVKDAQQAILDKATKRVEAEKDARLTKEWKAQEAAGAGGNDWRCCRAAGCSDGELSQER